MIFSILILGIIYRSEFQCVSHSYLDYVLFSFRRSVSDMNTNDQSDIDSVLEGISTQLAQIDSNIGDVNTYLNYPS